MHRESALCLRRALRRAGSNSPAAASDQGSGDGIMSGLSGDIVVCRRFSCSSSAAQPHQPRFRLFRRVGRAAPDGTAITNLMIAGPRRSIVLHLDDELPRGGGPKGVAIGLAVVHRGSASGHRVATTSRAGSARDLAVGHHQRLLALGVLVGSGGAGLARHTDARQHRRAALVPLVNRRAGEHAAIGGPPSTRQVISPTVMA